MQKAIKSPRGKCYKCMRPSSSCMCKHTNPIETNTRFVILMHPKEFKKEKNGTGHITNLQLKNAEIIVGVDFTNNNRVNEILDNEENSSFLLYPGKENFNLSIRKSTEIVSFVGSKPHVFVLDGTWPCARKMLKLSHNLQQLKRLSFDKTIQSKFIIKQQPEAICLSTIESVHTVLKLLKSSGVEQCDTTNFLFPFEKMLEYQVECILNPHNNNYSRKAVGKITAKNLYKKTVDRNTIFEKNGDFYS